MAFNSVKPTKWQYTQAWAVHAFTASAAFFGILTLAKIYQHHYFVALVFMGVAVFIDAVDGTFARMVHIKEVLPGFDGALLDNIVDYLNYVITPCFFLLVKADMLPQPYALWIIAAIAISSAYQFCQADAKTPDHFFKGFPCYWNFIVFYMFVFNSGMITNAIVLTLFCVLIFIPIKYVYPSRLDYFTTSKSIKLCLHLCSIVYGISSALALWSYPQPNPLWLGISLSYVVLYMLLSMYKTFVPLLRDVA